MICDVCGQRVPKAHMGRPRERHPECTQLNDALARVEKALPAVVVRCSPEGLLELWYRLFCLVADEIPRPRDALGRFLKREV